jgi:Zn-dependent M28 family amino/carboxypeptidase
LEPQTCGDLISTSGISSFEAARNRQFLPGRQLSSFTPLSIDTLFVIKSLREFSGDLEIPAGRILERGSVRGREAGQSYLAEEFSKLGLKVEKQCFSSGSYKGCNIVGILPGKTENVVVVSAHADSVKNAGADDDGSGIAALLAIAKSMKPTSWNATIHFVGFDLEEVGLVGSKAYVKEQLKRRTSIKGNINLEMLGYDSDNDGVFHVIDCKRKESLELVNLVTQSVPEKNNLKVSPYCTNRSDHASFWNAGIPAVVISQNFFGGDGNPCYHAACDKFDKVNTNYLNNLVDLAGNVVAKYANSN